MPFAHPADSKMMRKLILILMACLTLRNEPLAAKASDSAGAPPDAATGQTATINPAANWGTWEGWGCSLSWWANLFGNRDDLADLLFTDKSTMFQGRSLPGLALNVVRYQAGAWGRRTVAGVAMAVSPQMQARAQIEGYWLDGESTDPESKSWDWSVDANQRAMLLKAKERGANVFQMFSCSPLWWMLANRNPSGSADGKSDNLLPEKQREHAIYLATIAQQARSRWGVRFGTIEPFNEPVSNWWTATGAQEGCHFSPEAQASVIRYLRAELASRGLQDVKIAASDTYSYSEALDLWKHFSPETRMLVDQVDVHGYQKSKGPRLPLFQVVAGKKLWNSEYGENDSSGLSLARNLTLDLRQLHPAAWCYWQPLDGVKWGLIQYDLRTRAIGEVQPKYFVVAHYSRHIRPGMTIIDAGASDTVAAYDPQARKLVVVTANGGHPHWTDYDLSRFAATGGPVLRWLTQTGEGDKYHLSQDTKLSGKRFRAWFPANAVQTFEVLNVSLR